VVEIGCGARQRSPAGLKVRARSISLKPDTHLMRRALAALIVATLAAGGCGSSGAGGSSSTTTLAHPNRYFGEHPGQEATALHLGASDCAVLAKTVAKRTGRQVQRVSEPTPPNSHCQVRGRGVHVSLAVDAAYAARQRYSNRIDEQVQFNAADPAKVPQAVPGVGDKGAYNHFASWIPAYSTLWAVRGNRWLTIAYSVDGMTRPQRLAAAAPLARQAFRLSAR
jgi:hypothetical protein